MIKKWFVGLMALSLSNAAFAAHVEEEMLPVAPVPLYVTMPQQLGVVTLGLEALYHVIETGNLQRPSSVILDTSVAPGVLDATLDAKIHTFKPEYDWGIRFSAMYSFPGYGRDIEFDWTHFRIGDAVDARKDEGHSNINFDAVDLVFGQKIAFFNRAVLRPFGGVRFAAIKIDNAVHEAGVFDDGDLDLDVFNFTTRFSNNFQGLGPRAGIDANVRLNSYFAVVGTFGCSLLTGNQRDHIKANYILSADLIKAHLKLVTHEEDYISVVPELDARLGIHAGFPITPDIVLGAELGYDASTYFHANNSSIINFLDTNNNQHNVSLYGPYFRVQLDIL